MLRPKNPYEMPFNSKLFCSIGSLAYLPLLGCLVVVEKNDGRLGYIWPSIYNGAETDTSRRLLLGSSNSLWIGFFRVHLIYIRIFISSIPFHIGLIECTLFRLHFQFGFAAKCYETIEEVEQFIHPSSVHAEVIYTLFIIPLHGTEELL